MGSASVSSWNSWDYYEVGFDYDMWNNANRTYTFRITKLWAKMNKWNFNTYFYVKINGDEYGSKSNSSSYVAPGSGNNNFSGTKSVDVDLRYTCNYGDDGKPKENISVYIWGGNTSVRWINANVQTYIHTEGTPLSSVNNGNISPAYIDPWISITDPGWEDAYDSNVTKYRDRNANKNYTIKYSDNNGKTSGDDNIALYFYLNGNEVSKTNAKSANLGSGSYTFTASQIMKYAPFPAYDRQNSVTRALRWHTQTKKEDYSDRKVRFLYTPIRSVENLIMKYNNQTISGNIGDKKDITISWSYPSGEYGIVSGYEIQLRNKDSKDSVVKTYRTINTSITISSNDYKTLINYDFLVKPYYYHSATQVYSYGPSNITSKFISVYKLKKPKISYPLQNTSYTWFANKLYILATLSEDNDYVSIGNTYSYRNIEIMIDGITYSYTSYKNKYSITTLNCYNSKIVFVLDNVSNINHSIKLRCQKNYGYDDYSSSSSESWSDWSDIYYVRTQSYQLFSTTRGTKIMTSHINDLLSKSYNMYAIYVNALQISQIAQYSTIRRSEFIDMYNKLRSIYEVITGWGTYQNTSIKLTNFPSFNALIEEITADEKTTRGHDYFLIISKCIKFFST